jgi:integrase/recombinase XerD
VGRPVYRACLALIYACGLRIHEAVALRPEQIDGKNGVIRIIGKGNKQRLLPLPSSLLRVMRLAWTTHRNRQWVFATTPQGNHLSPRSVRGALHEACVQAGADPPGPLQHQEHRDLHPSDRTHPSAGAGEAG